MRRFALLDESQEINPVSRNRVFPNPVSRSTELFAQPSLSKEILGLHALLIH